MKNTQKYYLVEASALPEVFLKVAEAKRLLSTGEASTVNSMGSAAAWAEMSGMTLVSSGLNSHRLPITSRR